MATSSPTSALSASAPLQGATSPAWLLWSAVLLFVLTRGYLLIGFKPDASDVNGLYVQCGVRGVDFGRVPYQAFDIEYPPVAWWAMAAPRWIDPIKITPQSPRQDRLRVIGRYHRLFRGEMFLCDAV